MVLGIDLDNTIAIYDQVFIKYAYQIFGISHLNGKEEIANYLRNNDRKKDWTYLQGEVYGRYMQEAKVADYFIETISDRKLDSLKFEIVSHRTQLPSSGAKYNMHKIAKLWLEENLFLPLKNINDRDINVYFFESLDEKVQFIKERNYIAFIDDLIDVLLSPGFPKDTQRILYKSKDLSCEDIKIGIHGMSSWNNLMKILA
jgi:hypothetical protein